jgi:hypothetical protein
MNEIPHLENAMWAFDDAGLPYPELPKGPAPSITTTASPASAPETLNAELAKGESITIPIFSD